jgi:hypothetical protein
VIDDQGFPQDTRFIDVTRWNAETATWWRVAGPFERVRGTK